MAFYSEKLCICGRLSCVSELEVHISDGPA